jgi:UDP-2,4-diacetamido-2,4,6-trideoxy-beta-L-altropyranose hydrolase
MRILIRADAGPAIGVGHVMRCFALAQVAATKGPVSLATASSLPGGLAERLRRDAVVLHEIDEPPGSPADARATGDLAGRLGADWIVVDGYPFGPSYVGALRRAGTRVLQFDDDAAAPTFAADIILNQNCHATAADYTGRVSGRAQVLAGPRFAQIRREFMAWRGWVRAIAPIGRRVLVTLGGADPAGLTARIVEALAPLGGDLEVTVLAGSANPKREAIERQAAVSGGSLRIEGSTDSMASLMAWADVALMAGGATCWEAAFMGLPALASILVDHQRAVVEAVAARGVCENLGAAADLEPDVIRQRTLALLADAPARAEMSARGRELIDGRGSQRVVDVLLRELASEFPGPQEAQAHGGDARG